MTSATLTERADLDLGRRLMAFNWLLAGYAHRDWLGPWAEILEPRRRASPRLLRRVSVVLLDRFDLRSRYVRELGDNGWLLDPYDKIAQVARQLGTAMLGGWVRRHIERSEVALQHRVLGAEGRAEALRYGQRLRDLPNPVGHAWPVAPSGPATTFRLGVSCLAALIGDEASGARERFLLRFPQDAAVELSLTPRQRDEALSIVRGETP